MEFRLEFNPTSFSEKITIHDKIFLIGSCFTEHMFGYFSSAKFSCLQNPHGTLFNPISIFTALEHYLSHKVIQEDELFMQQGIWSHWDFHSKLSDGDKGQAVNKMNSAIHEANHFLQETDWLIVTLGTGFVYEGIDHQIVANCHKVPGNQFTKRLLTNADIMQSFDSVYTQLKAVNKKLKIIFTISPVRHLRDGFVENNRSKALLHHFVGECVNDKDVFYFPAFELIIDDLRDYRFYAEDMVHPNYQATQYVWEKFCLACIDGKTKAFMKELEQLCHAMKHKPFHPNSQEHLNFREKYKAIAVDLSHRFPALLWDKEIAYFTEN